MISSGFPETDPGLRRQRARDRANRVITTIAPRSRHGGPEETGDESARCELTAPTFSAGELPQLGSNFSHETYLAAVERVIEYIRAGDIFQANLAQRLIYPSDEAPLELYRRLRRCNPAPFAGFFSRDDWAIASASPERFLQLVDGVAETRPIKGTRRRHSNPQTDLLVAQELHECEKDLAENRMIVDLLRNDLSRVCRAGTIRVPQLCEVETYETVQHLVSVVQGQLREGLDAWDLLKATFPGGSITGAPRCGRWRSLPNWSRSHAGRIAGRCSMSALTDGATAAF